MQSALLAWGPIVLGGISVVLLILMWIRLGTLARDKSGEDHVRRSMEGVRRELNELRIQVRRLAVQLEEDRSAASAYSARRDPYLPRPSDVVSQMNDGTGPTVDEPAGVIHKRDTTAAPEQPRPANVETLPPPFNYERASTVYRHWKERGLAKPKISGWEISWMRSAGKSPGHELDPGRPFLQDSEGQGDFVRFSKSGSDEGLLFPNPLVELEPAVHGEIFPKASRTKSEGGTVEGVVIERDEDGRWQPR